MFSNEILKELKPQFLEFVVQDKEDGFCVPKALKGYLVTSIGGKDIYDVPLEDVDGLKEEIATLISNRVYVALAFLHSGDGVYVIDENGESLNSYSRGDGQIWVRKNKFFIVSPKGDTMYITGWDFSPYEPYCQNIVVLFYKVNAVPCKLGCFRIARADFS